MKKIIFICLSITSILNADIENIRKHYFNMIENQDFYIIKDKDQQEYSKESFDHLKFEFFYYGYISGLQYSIDHY